MIQLLDIMMELVRTRFSHVGKMKFTTHLALAHDSDTDNETDRLLGLQRLQQQDGSRQQPPPVNTTVCISMILM